jgi:hypothetical protein
MKVAELKKILEDVDETLDVRLYADHSQTPMRLYCYGYSRINEDSYMPEELDEEDEEYENGIKVFILGA